jgi:hypothetical protein
MILIVQLTACGISTGVKECGPEQRGASAIGRITLADGTSTANASIGMSEVREPGRPETVVITYGVSAQSDFLRTHVIRGELRDATTPSRLLASFSPPDLLPLPPNLFSGGGPFDWPVPAEEGRSLLVSGQLVLEIGTDLPDQPVVRIPFTQGVDDPTWSRARGEVCG